MHALFRLAAVSAIWPGFACSSAVAQQVTAWTGATVFDATSADAPPVADAVILVRDGVIEAIGSRSAVTIPNGAKTIDVSDKHIVPGLVDAHVHFFQSGGLFTRPDAIDLRSKRSYEQEQQGIRERLDGTFRRYLASGVTAVVDVGGPFWNYEVRDQAKRAAIAPRVAVAGPLVSTVSRAQLDIGDPPIVQCDTPEAARELVRRQVERGTDLVKIWFIVSRRRGVEEALPIAQATIDEAHKHGVRVAVHATELEAARAVVQAGADILVHSVDDQPVDEAFINLLKERGAIYTTTLVVHEGYNDVFNQDVQLMEVERRLGDPAVMATWQEMAPLTGRQVDPARAALSRQRLEASVARMQANLKALHDAGVVVAAGTDAGNIGTLHGPSLHRELQLIAAAGLTPAQTIVTATRNAARVFAAAPEFGTLEPGQRADFIVLDADPLANIAHLQRISKVVVGGVARTPDEILPPTPEQIVQRQVDAYNARDLDAFLEFYAPDAECIEHPSGRVVMRGRDEMRLEYDSLFKSSPELRCTIIGRVVSGSYVIDRELITGMGSQPTVRACAMYEVAEGRIRRVWFLPVEERDAR